MVRPLIRTETWAHPELDAGSLVVSLPVQAGDSAGEGAELVVMTYAVASQLLRAAGWELAGADCQPCLHQRHQAAAGQLVTCLEPAGHAGDHRNIDGETWPA